MSINLLALISATLTIATPLVWASIGEVIIEKTGVLNLGIEGTMYVGAFVGFLVAFRSGSPWLGLLTAVLAGVLVGALMGLLTVTWALKSRVEERFLRARYPAYGGYCERVRYRLVPYLY